MFYMLSYHHLPKATVLCVDFMNIKVEKLVYVPDMLGNFHTMI